jgi:hypothetical protein
MLGALEVISREHPDRVLRLRGTLPADGDGAGEAFELLIFRGFSSSITHPTAFDPDQPALPGGAEITAAELLEGPLSPGAERLLAGPAAVERYLDPEAWR